MRKHVSKILFLCAVLLFGSVISLRYKRDADKHQAELQRQSEAVIHGWQRQWQNTLVNAAQQGKLPLTYKLEFDRSGKNLRTDFFPKLGISRPWIVFRKMTDKDQIRQFLTDSLKQEGSWDRVLAIIEWLKRYGHGPEISFSDYEKTLFDQEARSAYQLIFQQFSSDYDFTFASNQFQMNLVLYRVQEDGNILAFVPSTKILKSTLLPEFLNQHNIGSAALGPTPWDISFTGKISETTPYAIDEQILALVSLILLAIAAILFYREYQIAKRQIIRKVSFLNQVVHEIKTPLAGLKLHADVIDRQGVRQESLEAIKTSVGRIDKLFSEITTLNQEKSGKIETLNEGDINKIFGTLSDEYQGCTFPDFSDKTRLRGSPSGVEIIMRNLVSNALSYGQRATVTTQLGEKLDIFVKDNGPGVRGTENIFQEFYRGESARLQRPDGLGLGLSVARKIARDYGGDLKLLNPGKPGAIFQLTLEVANIG